MWKHIINSHFFTIIYPIFLALSVVLGSYIAKESWINKKVDWESSGIESSVIAIFSLLLSFTFFASNNLVRYRMGIIYNIRDASANLSRTGLFTEDSIRMVTKNYLTV